VGQRGKNVLFRYLTSHFFSPSKMRPHAAVSDARLSRRNF
jgi:hypothetical protein